MRPETKGNARTNAILLVLAILALALFIAMGGDDRADLEEQARWQAGIKEQGAWVMW